MTVDILVSTTVFRQVLFKYLYWRSYISKSVLHNMQQNLCLIVSDKYEVQLDEYNIQP